jgi:hypothetical protein
MGNPIREVHLNGCLELLQVELHSFGALPSYEVVRSPCVQKTQEIPLSNLPLQEDKSIAFRLGIESEYLRAPRFGLGTIFGVMPHFITIETCSFGLHPKISLGLAPFERSPLLHKTSFWFEP